MALVSFINWGTSILKVEHLNYYYRHNYAKNVTTKDYFKAPISIHVFIINFLLVGWGRGVDNQGYFCNCHLQQVLPA